VRAVFRSAGDKDEDTIQHGSCVAVKHGRGVVFLTAAHVVSPEEGRKKVSVLLDGNERGARIERIEKDLDAAVLTVPGYTDGGLDLADAQPEKGQAVFIFGFPVKYSGTAFPRMLTTGGHILELGHPYQGIGVPVLKVRGGTHSGGSGGAITDADG